MMLQADPYAQAVAYYGLSAFLVRQNLRLHNLSSVFYSLSNLFGLTDNALCRRVCVFYF